MCVRACMERYGSVVCVYICVCALMHICEHVYVRIHNLK